MKLLDTVAIMSSLNPASPLHKHSMQHLNTVGSVKDALVPLVAILEADLVMKARGYTYEERRISWNALEHKIPTSKLITNSISSIRDALSLQEKGMDYFDSLITSLALEQKAVIITNDRAMARVVKTEW